MEQMKFNLQPQSALPTRHLYYRDFQSHPVYLGLYDSYRIVETIVSTNGREIIHHHLVEPGPVGLRF